MNLYTEWVISQQRQQEVARRAERAWMRSGTAPQVNMRKAVEALISRLEGRAQSRSTEITLGSSVCCPSASA